MRRLQNSCENFDDGDFFEASRIAIEISNLFHHGSSQPLAAVLKLQPHLLFDDLGVSKRIFVNQVDEIPLVILRSSRYERATFIPRFTEFSDFHLKQPYKSWWRQGVIRKSFHREFRTGQLSFDKNGDRDAENIIIQNMLGQKTAKNKSDLLGLLNSGRVSPSLTFTRKDLIVDERNLEGAHTDPSRHSIHDWFNDPDTPPWHTQFFGVGRTDNMTAYASTIRQIADETLRAIQHIHAAS
jgi:hypothetical protein